MSASCSSAASSEHKSAGDDYYGGADDGGAKRKNKGQQQQHPVAAKRTTGVADYFAILGVGEKLVWKHTQKGLQQQQQQQGMSGENEGGVRGEEEEPAKSDEEHLDALLEERFLREIVDVCIVKGRPSRRTSAGEKNNGGDNNDDDASERSSRIIRGADSFGQDAALSEASLSSAGGAGIPTLPFPPIALLPPNLQQQQRQQQQLEDEVSATIPAITSMASSYAADESSLHGSFPGGMGVDAARDDTGSTFTASSIGIDRGGWDIVQQTLPASRSSVPPSVGHGSPSTAAVTTTALADHHHHHNNDPSAILPNHSSTTLGTIQTGATSTVPNSINATWSRRQVWDANLDFTSGLYAQVNGTAQSGQRREPKPLKGLRRKMESTLRNWRNAKEEDGDGEEGSGASSTPYFYLAYKRRHPIDDIDRPALAQVELLYVRLHRSCCLVQDGDEGEATQPETASQVPKPSYLPGLAAQLLQRYQSQMLKPSAPQQEDDDNANKNNSNDDISKIVKLQDYLQLPDDSFEEWSIPPEYCWVRDPYSVAAAAASAAAEEEQEKQSDVSNANSKTLLFAQTDAEGGVEAIETVSSASSSLVSAAAATATTTTTTGASVHDISFSEREQTEQQRHFLPKLVSSSPENSNHSLHHHRDFVYIPILAIRRQRIQDEERYHERDTAIVDLTVSFVDHQGLAVLPDKVYDEDEDEDGVKFRILGKTDWASVSSATPSWRSRKRTIFGSPIVLARQNLPFGFADAAFATSVLDRFPYRNYKNLPLPEEELPMFCYPTGCRLHRARFSDAPLAEYYGFVVKNERGDSIYVSCVSFMEPLTDAKNNQLAQMSEKRRAYSLPHRRFSEERERRKVADMLRPTASFAQDDVDDSNFLLTGFDDMTTFEKKTICLVSRYPFWTGFRKFLSHLHILSTSSSELPLERYISHLLLAVPLPKPGGFNVIIPLPALNDPMVLNRPPEKDFPLVDLPYQRLVACLDIKTIVTVVLGLLALERKVIVMSTRPSLVLDVCELLRSLLFPFELCAPYVPRMTEPFQTSLEFPGALFVGIHKDGTVSGLAERVKQIPPEDSILVDLDTGEMDCDGDRYEVLSVAWDVIPAAARNMLVSELETLCRDAGIVAGQEPLDSQFDSAFDVTLPAAVEDFGTVGNTNEPLDDRAVRDAFLRFFCAVLGGYDRFLVVPDADFLVSGNEWFDSQGFLASVPSERAGYLTAFVPTQLFQSFIQRRTEASDVHCLLFDECISEFHASSVPYGRLGGDVETVPSFDNTSPPQLMYSLLVDQAATLAPDPEQTVLPFNRSMDASEAGSSLNLSKASLSLAEYSVKYGESAINMNNDLVTAPSRLQLPTGKRFMYCIDGIPCFPHRLNPELYYPMKPESWVIELLTNANSSNPLLARSERELEDANRRRRKATSYRGLSQRRCLWQLPKLMGSHFLGVWLLCIPVQVSQKHLSHEQQTRYLMRALGALRLLRSKQRIVPDEAAYRALMVACGRTQSDRRVELVKLFGLLRSDGIFPSAVTLGQYTRALAEGYSKRSGSVTQDDEFNGVEVSESASRIGRLSISSMNVNTRDMESTLCGLDATLGTLEGHGRRWRYKHGILPGETKADQKKRSSSKAWLPVSYSTSFVPIKDMERQQHEGETQSCVRLVALWSRTRGCSNCAYLPLEEEIQAGWDVVGGESETVACPRCGSLIVPMLGFKEMSLEEAMTIESGSNNLFPSGSGAADFEVLPPQISPTVIVDDGENVSYVPYISPSALRLSLEQYVGEMGEEALERDRLKELDPAVFYNFWWYCARFSLPLPLPVPAASDESGRKPLNFCAFAAWDRSASERGCLSAAKVLFPILQSMSNGDHIQVDEELENMESLDELPLLSRFSLQSFYSTVWDHVDLSAILVKLVEACDKRDFKPVGKFSEIIIAKRFSRTWRTSAHRIL